jgi:hypothetical protein
MRMLDHQQTLLLNMLRAHRTCLSRLSVALCAPNIGNIPVGSGSSCFDGVGGQLGKAVVGRMNRGVRSGGGDGIGAGVCTLLDGNYVMRRSQIHRRIRSVFVSCPMCRVYARV